MPICDIGFALRQLIFKMPRRGYRYKGGAVGIRRAIRLSPTMSRLTAPLHWAWIAVHAKRPVTRAIPNFEDGSKIEIHRFRSYEEYRTWVSETSAWHALTEREEWDALAELADQGGSHGHCALCERDVVFETEFDGSPDRNNLVPPNWREQLRCPHCQLNNRMRASFHIAAQHLGLCAGSSIYMTEQIGAGFRWISERFPKVAGSEYFGPGVSGGKRHNGIPHQDVQNLSYADSSFDYIMSFEVLEHVPDPDAAFRSMARVLKPGGRLLFTVPFDKNSRTASIRAAMQSDGVIVHYLPPEIHGNPTDPAGGALCFRYFGWDVIEQMHNAGFSDAEVITFWSRSLGHLGGGGFLFTARKT